MIEMFSNLIENVCGRVEKYKIKFGHGSIA